MKLWGLHASWVCACAMQEVGEDDGDAHWWRRMRLVMLRHQERLDTLLALHKGWVTGHVCWGPGRKGQGQPCWIKP